MRCTESTHIESVNRTVSIPISSQTSAVVNLGANEHSSLGFVSVLQDSDMHSQLTQINGAEDACCVSKIMNQQKAMLATADTKSRKLNLMRIHNILRQHRRSMKNKMTIFDVACPHVLNTSSDDECDGDILGKSSIDTINNIIDKLKLAEKVTLFSADQATGLNDFKDEYDGIENVDSRDRINTSYEIGDDEVFDDTDIENCDAFGNKLIDCDSSQRGNVIIYNSQEHPLERSQEHSQEHSNQSNLRDFLTSLTAANNRLYEDNLKNQHSFQKYGIKNLRANLSQVHSSHLSLSATNKNKEEKDRPISKFVERKLFRDITSKSVLEEALTDYVSKP